MLRSAIVSFLDRYLNTPPIADSSNNGLQVEGTDRITKIGLAVDACMESYEAAVKAQCQILIIHHGLIWDGIKYVTGKNHQHLKYLIDNNLNLYASHPPLDRHPVVGNNVLLAKMVGLINVKPAFDYHGISIGYQGELQQIKSVDQIAQGLKKTLGCTPVILSFGKRQIKRVGIVSGGAARELAEAIELGLDCYITGESSHENHHQAKEAGINVIYAGHYYTETVGVKAVGELLKKKFKVGAEFLDVPTIV